MNSNINVQYQRQRAFHIMSSQPSIDIAGPNKAIATGLSPLHKIIVGIDYGTTFSGVYYDLILPSLLTYA